MYSEYSIGLCTPVQCNFFVLRSNKVIDNMGTGCIASSVAEPFATHVTHNDARGFVNTTVFARVFWQITIVICLFLFLLEL